MTLPTPQTTAKAIPRQPHAVLDLESRRLKMLKIERLLELDRLPPGFRVLEIGCGSGGIAHYFATHPTFQCEVHAVDVVDNRQVAGSYHFYRVGSVQLPFADQKFDLVISNHVIEHVGDEAAQRAHLKELRRVMAPDGVGYLAVPNRWQLVEPHYGLAFLSWLPQAWRTPYLRLRHAGTAYDCRPLTVPILENLLRQTGFDYAQQHARALHLTYQLERPNALAYRALLKWLPESLYATLRRAFPTLIYRLHAARPDDAPNDMESGKS